MASRGTYGSRSTKVAEKEKDKSKMSMIGLSRKSSVTSTTSTTPKTPFSSLSWFSRRRKPASAPPPASPAPASFTTAERSSKPKNPTLTRNESSSRSRQQSASSPSLAFTGPNTIHVPDTESHRRNVLRRKPSSIDQRSRYARTEPSLLSEERSVRRYQDHMSSPDTSADQYSSSVSGAALPAVSASAYLPTRNTESAHQATSSSRMATYNARQAPKTSNPQLLPPLAPSFANSSGSSTTRRSESPGSFSRTSTPTSVSSYSPGIPATTKSPLRARQISPTHSRPPVTRNWQGNSSKPDLDTDESPGLSAVQELATSSSSSSTVRGNNQTTGLVDRNRVKNAAASSLRSSGQPRDAPNSLSPVQAAPKVSTSSSFESQQRRIDQYRTPAHDSFSQVTISASQLPSKTPPPRPSREGTPQLEDVVVPSPVIRSNLSRLETTGHKRRESLEKPLFPSAKPASSAATGASFLERSTLNDRSGLTKPSRLPSPTPATVESSQIWPIEQASSRTATHREPRSRNTTHGRESSPVSAGPGQSTSHFGLFPRRTSPLRIPSTESTEKPVKKGPAAGTGHEGYGKYARRGRSSSAGTSTSRGRSSSSNDNTASVARTPNSRKSSFTSRDEPEMDDFLRDRLSPVIISGGRVSGNPPDSGAELYRTTSGASSASIVSSDDSSLKRPRLAPRKRFARSTTVTNSTSSSSRASKSLPGEPVATEDITSSGAKAPAAPWRPTLASRRSLHRSQPFNNGEAFKVPAPIDTRATAPSPSMNSRDTLQSTALRSSSSLQLTDDISEGREGNWLRSRKAEKPTKSPSMWNFFQRATATQKTPPSRRPSRGRERPQELPVTVTPLPESRSVAYYAMIDNNGQDIDDPEGLVPSLTDVERLQSSFYAQETPANDYNPSSRNHEHTHSILLPSPPNMAGEFTNIQGPPSPKVLFRQPALVPQPPVEAPRLAQKPSQSRLQQVGRIPRVVSKRDRPHKPPPQSFSRPFARAPDPGQSDFSGSGTQQLDAPDRPVLGIQTERIPSDAWGEPDSAKPASAPARSQTHAYHQDRDEFLIMPQRINSELSGSSSSGILSFVLAPADAKQTSRLPAEDEVWNEYDDFLDTVESPGPLLVDPFEKASKSNNQPKSPMAPAPLKIRKGSASSTHSTSAQDLPPITVAPTSALPSPPSRMALLSPDLTSSPMSFSDFIAGYGDRNRSSGLSNIRQSSISGSHYSQASFHSTTSSSAEQKRHTQIMADKTRNSSGSHSNLRFSALMTSRWLSFGRVLFSPAHNEIMQSTKQTTNRVLVLDGLGNDDWSFYCALTYPDATVHNLSSFKRMGSASSRKNSSVQAPGNHRQIFHAGMSAPFPFPKGYFSAAVFRFPVATTEAAYYNAISECKRVLRPGGYLEISILDLDMVNMGNRARRAVRALKTRMQVARKDVDLKPLSDNLQKMLGRRGFEGLRRGMVTVPVAGVVGDSRSGSFDTERDLSFGDLIKDSSPQGDESITKMVSRVGRWWYSRCYESTIFSMDGGGGGDSEQSMWSDRALLKECQKRETGLKLLICYAQKPEVSKRRTISL